MSENIPQKTLYQNYVSIYQTESKDQNTGIYQAKTTP